MKHLVILVLLILAHPVYAEETTIRVDGSVVWMTGKITTSTHTKLFEQTKDRQIKTLVVDVSGGETWAAMEIGTWIHENQIDIEVAGKCFSSCANYLFTAANIKTIRPGALVAWHGDLTQHSLDNKSLQATIDASLEVDVTESEKEKILTQYRRYIAEGQQRQKTFFEKIGVDARVCSIGHEYGAEDFFILSVADMNTLGIRDIQAPADYHLTDLTELNKKRPFNYIKIEQWNRSSIPGGAVGVVHKGKLIFSKGYGKANMESGAVNDKNTVFRIASTSKQFTAAAIVLLVESRRLRFEDRLSQFFPEFPDYA